MRKVLHKPPIKLLATSPKPPSPSKTAQAEAHYHHRSSHRASPPQHAPTFSISSLRVLNNHPIKILPTRRDFRNHHMPFAVPSISVQLSRGPGPRAARVPCGGRRVLEVLLCGREVCWSWRETETAEGWESFSCTYIEDWVVFRGRRLRRRQGGLPKQLRRT